MARSFCLAKEKGEGHNPEDETISSFRLAVQFLHTQNFNLNLIVSSSGSGAVAFSFPFDEAEDRRMHLK
jgi:hypothetical protein